MDKTVFAERLRLAAVRARDFARTQVIESLPDAIRFEVQLNSSYDGNPLHPDERLYPDDPERIPEPLRTWLTEEQVIELLWRDDTVPEWINLTVSDEDGEHTLVEAACCGRFTANEQLLYHEQEGYPPFHVLGPGIPPSHSIASPANAERFSLHWNLELGDRRELATLRDRAEHVQILTLSGTSFDDEALEELASIAMPRLCSLMLEKTRVRGRGLRHLESGAPVLSTLEWTSDQQLPLDLRALAPFTRLESLKLESGTAPVEGLSTLSSLRKLSWLVLQVPNLEDTGWASPLDSLYWLELTGCPVKSLKGLARLRGLEILQLSRTAVEDKDLLTAGRLFSLSSLELNETSVGDDSLVSIRRHPNLRRLALDKTRVSDHGLKYLPGARLREVHLRGTQVTEQGVRELRRKRPELLIRSAFEQYTHPEPTKTEEKGARRYLSFLKRK